MHNRQDALIGHTGFVGSNLARQWDGAEHYNSSNFREMIGRSFGTVICAGVRAVKWKANKEPEADWREIQSLMDVLKTIQAREFVLVSTIDVYPQLSGLDESYDCGQAPNHAYGRHRLALESFCQKQFGATVIRLPALFGDGLRKNIVYDLLHDNCLESINAASSFQFYDLNDFWADIQTTLGAGLKLVNLFPESLSVGHIISELFPGKQFGAQPAREAHYDLRTRHGEVFGGGDGYIRRQEELFAKLRAYVSKEILARK